MNSTNKSIVSHTIILGIICAMTVLSCPKSPQLTAINITNNSKNELNDVVVSGTGFSQKVGKIKINEKTSIFVKPSSESTVTVNFNAAGKNYSSGKQGYFEPGYHSMTVQIAPNLTVKIDNAKLLY